MSVVSSESVRSSRSSMTSQPYDVLVKVMMLGHSSVGKSSLISSLAEQPFTTSHLHTIGIDFKIKHYTIKGKKVKVQIWDSAGQERYDTIIKPYYREAQGFILVFDLSNHSTFDQLPRWIENIELHGSPDDVVLVLAGNKSDLPERPVDQVHIENVCKIHNMKYFETSAKNRHNVDQMFLYATEEILNRKGFQFSVAKEETIALTKSNYNRSVAQEEEKKKCCKN